MDLTKTQPSLSGSSFAGGNQTVRQSGGALLGSEQTSNRDSETIPSEELRADWISLQNGLCLRALVKIIELIIFQGLTFSIANIFSKFIIFLSAFYMALSTWKLKMFIQTKSFIFISWFRSFMTYLVKPIVQQEYINVVVILFQNMKISNIKNLENLVLTIHI